MHKKYIRLLSLLIAALLLGACTPAQNPGETASGDTSPSPSPEITAAGETAEPVILDMSKKRRTFYEIFVGSFCDSDGDGLGDFQGAISKLDYLNNDRGEDCLGVDGIWLMPIMPSPTYHKYDVSDYYAIDPGYGTMEDFEQFLAECALRGIDVIIDLPLNHTSTEHPWFKAAKEELKSGSEPLYQNYYNIADTKAGTSYYTLTEGYYYEGLFWSGMPDLNMDNPAVRAEVEQIAKFWLDKGVAGFRLDAAKHIYNFQNQNIEFWSWFAGYCHTVREDAFLIAEVWGQDGEVLAYYETGLDAMFNFGFAGVEGIVHSAASRSDGTYLASNIDRFDKLIRSRDPEGIHAPFLSNHDTDRSAGYISDLSLQKLEAAIYLLIPGSPFIYYGEEIGMTGKGRDENKRTAMLWSSSDPAGITKNPAAADAVTPPEAGVAEQLADENSLLNYYRQILALKARYPDLSYGATENLKCGDKRVCALSVGNVALLHNLSEDGVTVDVSSLCPGKELDGFLSPLGGDALWENGILTIPPYGTVVLV